MKCRCKIIADKKLKMSLELFQRGGFWTVILFAYLSSDIEHEIFHVLEIWKLIPLEWRRSSPHVIGSLLLNLSIIA